ncbi:hypothetical protein PMAYCL1PPCAC_03237, partial [Pristionchus mayeri]
TFSLSFARFFAFKMTKGFDASAAMSKEGFEKMRARGYSRFIGRLGKTTGQVDKDGIQNMKYAYEAGFAVDAYIFPKSSMSAESQVAAALDALSVPIDIIWWDVETHNCPTTFDAKKSLREVSLRIRRQENQARSIIDTMPRVRSLIESTLGRKMTDMTYKDVLSFGLSVDLGGSLR